jgi:hypothetical protein
MKRATEKVCELTKYDLIYDGINHVDKLSDFADSVQEYVDRVKDSDVFVKTSSFDRHLTDNPDDIKVVSFSDMKNALICYALIYKSSLSPFFVSGVLD